MQFISVRDLRGKSAQIWRRLKQKRELVITSNGKPIAILSPTSEETLEESLNAIRTARAIEAVEAIQTQSVKAGRDKMTLEKINREIEAVRRTRLK